MVGKILEFIVRGALRLAGPWGEKVWEIIQAAGAVLMTILEDPLGFAKNLFAAVIKGFKQFGTNIWEHIKSGLLGWLFGTLKGLDLEMPERLDFKGLISIGLQIVGLTYANFRKIMVKKLGANGERKMAFIEKSVEAVKILVKEGFVGMWQRVFQMIDNFRETVLGGIRDFVIKSLIMGGISWLAGLSNPVGAVIKVVLSIYNMIVTFLERLDQILEVAQSIFASIGAIAAGRIQEAADFIERTMAAAIPVIIAFLAALVPVTGITNSIRSIIAKLRDAVNRAIDKLVTFVAKKAKKLFSKLIAKINSKRKLPSANFTFGKKKHRIFAEQKGKKIETLIASGEGNEINVVGQASADEAKKMKDKAAAAEAGAAASEVNEADKETGEKASKLNPGSEKENQLKGFAALEAELKEAAAELQQVGTDTDSSPKSTPSKRSTCFAPRSRALKISKAMPVSIRRSARRRQRSSSVAAWKTARSGATLSSTRMTTFPRSSLRRRFSPTSTSSSPAARGRKWIAPARRRKRHHRTNRPPSPTIGELGNTIKSIPEDGKGLPAMTIYRPVHMIKKSTPAAKATAMVEAAAQAKGDRVSAVKKLLSDEIKLESDKIVEIVRKDASATDAIRAKIDAGIAAATQRTRASTRSTRSKNHRRPQRRGQSPTPRSASCRSRATAPTSPISSRLRASTCHMRTSNGLREIHGIRPCHRRRLAASHQGPQVQPPYASGKARRQAERRNAHANERPKAGFKEQKQSRGRPKPALEPRRQEIFSEKQRMWKYETETGPAIALYRPVHRAVTLQLTSPRDDSIPAAAITDQFVEPLAEFILEGDLDELAAARGKAQDDLKRLLVEKTEAHVGHIADQYVHELRAVKKINKKMESAAHQAMVRISATVRDSLVKARSGTRICLRNLAEACGSNFRGPTPRPGDPIDPVAEWELDSRQSRFAWLFPEGVRTSNHRLLLLTRAKYASQRNDLECLACCDTALLPSVEADDCQPSPSPRPASQSGHCRGGKTAGRKSAV